MKKRRIFGFYLIVFIIIILKYLRLITTINIFYFLKLKKMG